MTDSHMIRVPIFPNPGSAVSQGRGAPPVLWNGQGKEGAPTQKVQNLLPHAFLWGSTRQTATSGSYGVALHGFAK